MDSHTIARTLRVLTGLDTVHTVTTHGPRRYTVAVTTDPRTVDRDTDLHELARRLRRDAFTVARTVLAEFDADPESGYPTVAVEPSDVLNVALGYVVDVRWER